MTEMASTSDNSNTSTINEQENEESRKFFCGDYYRTKILIFVIGFNTPAVEDTKHSCILSGF